MVRVKILKIVGIDSEIISLRKARMLKHPIKNTETVFQIVNYSNLGKISSGKPLINKKIALNLERDEFISLSSFLHWGPYI